MIEFLLVLHIIGIALGLGTGFAFMTLGIGTKNMPPEERTQFMLKAFVISKMGSVGLILLILSGVALFGMKWNWSGGMFFHIKMTLLAVFVVLFGLMQAKIAKAKREKGGPVMATIPKLGGMMNLTAVLIAIFGVLAFN